MFNRLRVVIDPEMDPDDTYNETPYEKGFMFVSYLQSLVGDPSTFDDFLKAYVNNFKYKVNLVGSPVFLCELCKHSVSHSFILSTSSKLTSTTLSTRGTPAFL